MSRPLKAATEGGKVYFRGVIGVRAPSSYGKCLLAPAQYGSLHQVG